VERGRVPGDQLSLRVCTDHQIYALTYLFTRGLPDRPSVGRCCVTSSRCWAGRGKRYSELGLADYRPGKGSGLAISTRYPVSVNSQYGWVSSPHQNPMGQPRLL